MKRATLLIITFFIAFYSVASEPITIWTKIFACWSLNKNYSLNVITKSKTWCIYDEDSDFAIAVVKKQGEKKPFYFFRVKYDNWYDYIISETGETVIQLISFSNSEKLKDGTFATESYSEIKVFNMGKLVNKFILDFAFCTYSTKTMYQDPVLNINDLKYLNLISDTLYVVSDTNIYKINIKNGKAYLATEKVNLNSYKYSRKKVRSKHLKEYQKYDRLLNTQ